MRVAFASCMCTRVFQDQPVWDQIAAHQPEYLVLLGDSIYLDINSSSPPQDMSDNDFGLHLFSLYSELLNQNQFASLVRKMPKGSVFSIWDDHDFLWNDALGAEAKANPQYQEKVRLSTAFQEAFRSTLTAGLSTGTFPVSYGDPLLWNQNQLPLTTPSIQLSSDTWLHLCDVRSWRTDTWLVSEAKRTLLGAAQCAHIEASMKAAPDAVHLIASGSTMSDWKHYTRDLKWLLGLAARQRTVMLSGDIHRNDVDAFYTGGWPLHEATSSGAAVRDAVVVGKEQQNFGLLDINASSLSLRLFHRGREQTLLSRTYDRATWLPR